MEQALVTAITHELAEAKVTVTGVPDRPGSAARLFRGLADHSVNVDMIVQNTSLHGTTDISFTVPARPAVSTRGSRRARPRARGDRGHHRRRRGKVVAHRRRHEDPSWRDRPDLRDARHPGINIEMISTSSIRISCMVRAEVVRRRFAPCTPPSSSSTVTLGAPGDPGLWSELRGNASSDRRGNRPGRIGHAIGPPGAPVSCSIPSGSSPPLVPQVGSSRSRVSTSRWKTPPSPTLPGWISRCSRAARLPLGRWPLRLRRPGPSSSTIHRPGAWTPMCRWSFPR